MISITIPYFKGLHLLHLAIKSVLAQTSTEWRLTVSDDGGLELGASELVASFRDERIRYSLSQTRLGMVGNWNRCLDISDAPFVTLLHADDELLPNYVQCMEDAWKYAPDVTAIFCQPKIISETGERVFSFPDAYKRLLIPTSRERILLEGETALTGLIRGNYIFCPTLCYRKEAIAGKRFDPKWKMVQDLDFTTSILLNGGKLLGIPDVVYAYRRHANNATNAYTRSMERFEEELELFKELGVRCREKNWARAEKTAERASIVKLHLAYRISEDALYGRWQDAADKARFFRSRFIGK